MLIVCSYLCQTTKFYLIISKLVKVVCVIYSHLLNFYIPLCIYELYCLTVNNGFKHTSTYRTVSYTADLVKTYFWMKVIAYTQKFVKLVN